RLASLDGIVNRGEFDDSSYSSGPVCSTTSGRSSTKMVSAPNRKQGLLSATTTTWARRRAIAWNLLWRQLASRGTKEVERSIEQAMSAAWNQVRSESNVNTRLPLGTAYLWSASRRRHARRQSSPYEIVPPPFGSVTAGKLASIDSSTSLDSRSSLH